MTRLSWMLCLFLCLLGAFSTLASAQLAWDAKEFMGIDEIHPGMRGYGKTVYQGTKIETFDVEVIGVLRKIDFGFDMILIKVTSGPVVDRKLQTVAGMSGSPIYLDDRLIGAYAYGWDFQQEAIAGVTPIAAMLDCTQPGSVSPSLVGSLVPQGKVLTVANKLITRVKVAATHDDAAVLQAKADPTTMVLAPCAAPVMVSGMPDAALKPLRQLFEKYNLRAEAGAGQADGPAPPLEPGSAVGVSLMEGDANMTAVGTVTYVKGDTVLAFGHPFFGWGKINMPMSVAYVHGIINSATSSFKMASPIARVGAAVSDRQFALGGTLGKTPDTMPVTLYLKDAQRNLKKAYGAEMIQHPAMTPYMLYLWILFSGASQLGDFLADDGTFTARAVINTDKLGAIEQNLVLSPQINADFLPMGEFYFLTELLGTNPYEPVKLRRVSVELSYAPEKNFAIIEKITPDRLVAHPGDTVNLAVKIRPYGKPVETQTVTVKVPEFSAEPAMLVLVAGGAHSMLVKGLLEPFPTPEEGVKGIVRWFTDNVTAQNMLTAQLFPTPSYGYRGRMLKDLPLPVFDVLQVNDIPGMLPSQGDDGGKDERNSDSEDGGSANANTRPTFYLSSQPEPYVLVGGEAAMIKIQTEEASMLSRGEDFNFAFSVPVLSSSLIPDRENPAGGRTDMEASMRSLPWYTPQQRARIAMLSASLQPAPATRVLPALPSLRMPAIAVPAPLSFFQVPGTRAADQAIEPQPGKGDKGAKKPSDGEEDAGPDEDNGGDEDDDTAGPPAPSSRDNTLLSKRFSWGLTGRNDFLRGKHLGTGVTSKGTLMLIPAVRALFATTEMVPSHLVATANGTYVAGWNSNKLLRIGIDGKASTIYPKQDTDAVQVITALAADAAGNLLIGLSPDQTVLLLSPDGDVQKTWRLPGSAIWSLAVTSGGKRYAGTDASGLYLLKDDERAQVGAPIADKHVYALAAGPNDDIYAGTYPRGKVYHVKGDGSAESIYEARGAVASLAADRKGNVYIGTSPTCRVVRVSPDGTTTQVMRGMGRGNRHVLALQVVGDELYAATGPAGGIYRISGPTTQDAEVTPIFARADTRDGADEGNGGTGAESLMVNALALSPQGTLLAAASTPGQILALEPRTKGTFLSSVLQTPTVARWGQLETHVRALKGQTVVIESRSGNTAIPDATWGPWKALSPDGAELTSAPATFAQFRVQMTGTPANSPVLEYARLYYQPTNQAPKITLESPKAGAFWSGTKDIRWDARDPDEDKLIYTIFISKDDGQTWSQLSRPVEDKQPVAPKPEEKNPKRAKKDAKTEAPAPAAPKMQSEVEDRSINWDSKSVPDGLYRVRVIASDKYARPTDAKSGEAISGRFTVDNTAPIIALDEKVYGWERIKRFDVIDNLTPIIGGRYKIDDGEWTALVAEDTIFNGKKESVLLVSPNGAIDLPAGQHKVIIQVKDSANNQSEKNITLVIGEKPPQPTARLNIPPVGQANDKDLAELILYNLQ